VSSAESQALNYGIPSVLHTLLNRAGARQSFTPTPILALLGVLLARVWTLDVLCEDSGQPSRLCLCRRRGGGEYLALEFARRLPLIQRWRRQRMTVMGLVARRVRGCRPDTQGNISSATPARVLGHYSAALQLERQPSRRK